MNAQALVVYLRSLDIQLKANGEKLQISAPKGVLTAELRREIATQKVAILQELQAAEADDSAAAVVELPAIRRLTRQPDEPLSWPQQRLWFLSQMDPASTAYNVPVAYRLRGELDVGALEQSVREIVRRHEVLRTTIALHQAQPRASFSPSGAVSLQIKDLRECQAPEEEASRLTMEELRAPFDLEKGPLLRAVLLCLADREHVLMFSVHHIVFDMWSYGVLKQELKTLYADFKCGEASTLTELPLQYADSAAWQHRCVSGAPLERQVAYWKKQLEGSAALLEVPTDRPRPAQPSLRGAVEAAWLPRTLAADLRRCSREQGASLFMLTLAAYGVLLHRLTGEGDFCVGSPIAGRNQPELEGLIGFFVNTLVLRLELSGDLSFRDFLSRVRDVAFGAYANQELPFERLVEELQPARVMSHSPLFQVMFAMQNTPSEEFELEGLRAERFRVENTTSKFDLALYVEETAEGLEVSFEYSTDLFERATIVRWLGCYERLLEGIVANPEAKIADLPWLTTGEARQRVEQWNDTKTDYPASLRVQEVFEAQVALRPDAPAVRYGDGSLSYRELDARANQVAHALRARGVARGDLVGLCVDRSAQMVVGLLGILKAGAGYLPLDPDYPKPRIAFMLEDARVALLVTQERHLEALTGCIDESRMETQVLCLDRDWAKIAQYGEESPKFFGNSKDLAYVIYTSGSTGRPKGVAVPHQAVTRLVLETNYVDLGPGDRIAQVSNVSFDAATFELFGALLCGAELVGIERDVLLSPQEIARVLRHERVSTLFLTTALFNQVAREIPDAFATLRYLLFGGEAVDPGRVREVLEQGAPETLLHVYGPTETTTYATWQRVESVARDATSVPIGQPLSNGQLYVLDPGLSPVPFGVPGELYLGGDGLARGYLERPGLTAERFVPNPFAVSEPGSRLYRTGDRVRQDPSGAIEFLGRMDQQVKLRGFRIELGEIESMLLRHENVEEAVVVLREDVPGNPRLVAYAVASAGAHLAPAVVRSHLAENLPPYMIPSALVQIDALPLDPNGKVDRKLLPAPETQHQGEAAEFVAPGTPLEIELARIWCQLLEVSDVGVHDNFFEIGGHSLLATQVVSLIRGSLQAELPLRRFFQAPTIDGLANGLAEIFGDRETAEEVARIAAEVSQLSDEEVSAALAE